MKTINLEFDGYWREPNKSSVPDKSGVYVVYECSYDAEKKTVSLKKIIYMGESGNARDRIDGHEKWPEWRKQVRAGNVICFSFAPIGNPDRERAEAALIFKHKPPTNTEYVNSFPFDETTVTSTGMTALLHTSFTVQRTKAALAQR